MDTLRIPVLLLLASWLPLGAERTQAADAPWRTVRTAHYRIHYPARGGFEPFASEIASKIEGIHARVTEWVGYESPRSVEVVIKDPLLESNGMAVPLLKHPFVVLWRTPPEPDSGIAHVTTWAELLVTRELTHIHHLLRPQQRPNLGDRLLDLPVGPLARKVPRWVSEGYATVIEGRITGKGRPHSATRAALIRQWALEGKLPDYGQVSATTGFRGGSLAYLIGSAYLEWLESRAPQDPRILQTFWKQLVSARRRGFEASFKATFGFPARDGYDRWRAETTRDALELERRARAEGWLQEGAIFTKVDGEVADLAVSPDGTRLLARVATPRFRGLQVWDLREPRPGAAPRTPGRPDPEGLVDAAPAVPDRKPTWTLGRVLNAVPRRARWEGDAVLFELRLPNAEGVLEPSLHAWTPGRRGTAARGEGRSLPVPSGVVEERGGLWTILQEGRPAVRTLAAAWSPAPTPDGRTLFYAQLSATGVEIRRLEGTRPIPSADLPADPAPLTRGTVLPPGDGPSLLPAPVAPPPSAPYAPLSELRTGSRAGLGVSPSGVAYQLGWGGSDLLGRASWQVLAGFGNGAGPRGAAAGAAWRGWRWAPALEVFSSLERPSRQEGTAPPDLDRERRGAELSFTFEDRGRWPFRLRPLVATERVEDPDGGRPGGSRALAGLEAGLRWAWRPGERWGLEAQAESRVQRGRSLQQDWSLQRAGLRLRLRPPGDLPALALEAEAGRLGGAPTAVDLFHLGGLPTSLVPASLDASRIVQPALPDHLQRGDRFRRARASLGGAFRGYWEAALAWDRSAPRPSAQRTAGIEFALTDLVEADLLAPILGRSTFTLGLHRLLGEGPAALKDRLVFTASVVLRP